MTAKTCHAAELVATVAGLTLGRALKGPTQRFITDVEVWQAQQTRDFASGATLDDLSATSVHFAVPLQLLRRERELNWDVLGTPTKDRPDVLEDHRNISANRLIGWLDGMRAFGLLTNENADELIYQVLDLRDGTPGATAKDARTAAPTQQAQQVLYAYHCDQCGHRGQLRHPEEHETISAECEACGAAVAAEWDGGVELTSAAARPTCAGDDLL